MRPIEIAMALERCSRIPGWQRDETIKRFRWAVDSYVEGYISKETQASEVSAFLAKAETLIAEEGVLYIISQPPRPLTPADMQRRQEWLQAEAERATRAELQRQRKRLREGQATLTAIRRLLAHGVRSSLPLVSEPEMSSPT